MTVSSLGCWNGKPGASSPAEHPEDLWKHGGAQNAERGRCKEREHDDLGFRRRVGKDRPLRWRHTPDGASRKWGA